MFRLGNIPLISRVNKMFFLGTLLTVLGFLFYLIPVHHQYQTFQMAWHDHGHLYDMILNWFKYGTIYSIEVKWSLFRSHLDIILIPLAYVFRLFSSFSIYLAAHCLVLALSATVVFYYVSDFMNNRILGFISALAFFANPFSMSINLYTHFEVFGMLFLLLYSYSLYSDRVIWSTLFMLAALITKQDFFLYVNIIALVHLNRRRLVTSCTHLFISTLYFLLVVNWLWPSLQSDPLNFRNSIWNFGNTIPDQVLYLFTNMDEVIAKAFTGYGLAFQLSFLFLPVFAGFRYFLALAPLILWVNATEINRASLSYYYSYSALTLFFVVWPYALKNLGMLGESMSRTKFFKGKNLRLCEIACLTLFCFLIREHFELPEGLRISPNLERIYNVKFTDRHQHIHRVLKEKLDKGTTVLTQFYLSAYIPKTSDLQLLWVDLNKLDNETTAPDYVVIDGAYRGFYQNIEQLIDRLNKMNQYLLVSEDQNFYVWRRL